MASPRASPVALVLPNGKVLVAGGANRTTYLATAELYTPATGTWSAAGSMGAPRGYPTGMVLPNGKVLVMGGYAGSSSLSTAELYTP
jgi:alkylated DNA repair dioxygenase AlkB